MPADPYPWWEPFILSGAVVTIFVLICWSVATISRECFSRDPWDDHTTNKNRKETRKHGRA